MIKIITIITKFIIATIIALFFSSCKFSNEIDSLGKSITGSGHITTEKREVTANFKKIEVNKSIDLIVEQADKLEIIVEADDNLQKDIITKIDDDVLVVTFKNTFNLKSGTRKVIVKMPLIESLQASSTSSIKSSNILKGENINVSASSAAEIDLNLEFENININSSSGSSIDAKGKALKLEVNSSSGGEINADELLANDVIALASSGGGINIHPLLNLDAKASSGGDIKYNNTPKSIQKSTSSGGSINGN